MVPKQFATLVLLSFVPLVLGGPSHPKLVKGVDTGRLIPKDKWPIVYRQGFTHAIFRGYQENYKPKSTKKNPHPEGGRVDPHFLTNYQNAKAAHLTVDAYWFPCSGKLWHCKHYDQQVRELMDFIRAHNMKLDRIWLDVEIDIAAANWDYGRDSQNRNGSNLIEAKKMAAALKAVYPRYGIYSTPGEWFNIFGAFDPILDNNAPLWWATWNNKKSYHDMLNPLPRFGGWSNNKIVGKQYTNESASGLFNLNVFLNP